MELSPHWATLCKCSSCGEIPEIAPMYHCPFQHQYCSNCFNELRKNYRGSIDDGCTCKICKVSGKFQESKINTDFLRKLKIKPGIGRPCRYNVNLSNPVRIGKIEVNHLEGHERQKVTVETLFQLPSDQIRRLLNRKSAPSDAGDTIPDLNYDYQEEATTSSSRNHYISDTDNNHLNSAQSTCNSLYTSKKPVKCPHDPCNKMVAISAIVTHFKHEHTDIPKYSVERGKELCLACDVSIIEHKTSFCLAMLTVYEINTIDVIKSRSTQSVIKTCSKFCQKVPLNTFWLMVSGSCEEKSFNSYAIYWLFSSNEEHYRCTIELSSKHDSTSISTFCNVNTSKCSESTITSIATGLNCLLLTKASFVALLKEGPELNLRVTVH